MKLFESLLFLTIAYASISNSKDSDPDTNSVSICDPFKKITKKFTPKSDGSLHLKSVITDESLGNFTFVNGLECPTDSYATEAEIIAQFKSVLATGTLSCEAPVWDGPKVVLECLIGNGNANELDDFAVTVVWAQDINDDSTGGSDDCDYKVESLSVAQTQCLLPACDFSALVDSLTSTESLLSDLSTFNPSVSGTLNEIDCDGMDNNSSISDLAANFAGLDFVSGSVVVNQVSPTEISVTAEIVNNDPFVISETIALTFVDVTTSYGLCMHEVSSYVITVVPCCPKEKVLALSGSFAAASDIQPLYPSVTGNFTLVNGLNVENKIVSGVMDVTAELSGISGVLACDDPVEVGNPVTEVTQSCAIDGDLYSVDLVWIDVGDCMFEVSSVIVVETQALLPPCDLAPALIDLFSASSPTFNIDSSVVGQETNVGALPSGACHVLSPISNDLQTLQTILNQGNFSAISFNGNVVSLTTPSGDLELTFENEGEYGICDPVIKSYVLEIDEVECCIALDATAEFNILLNCLNESNLRTACLELFQQYAADDIELISRVDVCPTYDGFNNPTLSRQLSEISSFEFSTGSGITPCSPFEIGQCFSIGEIGTLEQYLVTYLVFDYDDTCTKKLTKFENVFLDGPECECFSEVEEIDIALSEGNYNLTETFTYNLYPFSPSGPCDVQTGLSSATFLTDLGSNPNFLFPPTRSGPDEWTLTESFTNSIVTLGRTSSTTDDACALVITGAEVYKGVDTCP